MSKKNPKLYQFECEGIIPACACKRNVVFHRVVFDNNEPRAILLSTN